MSTTTNPSKKRNILSPLVLAGTEGIVDEEERNRVINVNKLSLAFGGAILAIAPLLCYYLKWRLWVLIPISAEFVINCSVIVLNHRRKYRLASLILFFLQFAAILYFGAMLGRLLQLQFTIVFLISIIYLIFKEPVLRKIALAAAFVDLVVLEICYYKNIAQPAVPLSS